MNKKNKIGFVVVLAGCVASTVTAGDLTSYAAGDVQICFRNPGSGLSLVVDAGPISTFTGYGVNTRHTISAFSPAQLADVGLNGTSWSAFTYLADNTLYLTKANVNALYKQSNPPTEQSSGSQAGTALRMATIPKGATNFLNPNFGYPFTDSTTTAVIEQYASAANPNYPVGSSYHDAIFGAFGSATFNGTISETPELTTANGYTDATKFTGMGTPVRADFYLMSPSGSYGSGTMIGYFELNTNGVMTYVAYPSQTPTINSFTRAGGISTIDYTAGLYGTYTLRGVSSLTSAGAPTNWPAITTLTSGDAADHIVTDTNAATSLFYSITAPSAP